ncbi:MAG: TerB N-terminal domain-containing protein [Victivallaceae bacterium]|nr:TerB N-terminal domain-containing protein [Victivallaceae bacterium]
MNADSQVSGVIQPKIYQDEPIRRTAEQLAGAAPPEYREMRRIAYGSAGYLSDVVIFCRQGKFMEDFEDDFEYDGEFLKYYPTYQDMNDHQLRGYFSWRTKVRRGIVAPTSLSFAFVYIYELINQIGVSSPAEGFRALKEFWTAYREIAPGIDRYCKLWLKDYAVYYGLDRSLLDDVSSVCFDREIMTLQNPREHAPDELFSALDAMSSYKMTESRFFKLHPDDVTAVVCKVYAALADHYGKNGKGGVCEKLFGKLHSGSYRMFTSAVFYDRRTRSEAAYAINDFHKYRCVGGEWSCEKFLCYREKMHRLGALLKNIDFLMRGKYGFNSALKPEKMTKLFGRIITGAIDEYLECKRRTAAPKIEIDLSKLHGIRRTSLETQNRLIVEEIESPAPAPAGRPAGNGAGPALTAVELRFLGILMRGEDYDGYLKSNHLMPSVLVDSINEKLFDRFGDTPIVCDGDRPELLADYLEELKGIVQP